MKKPTPIFDSLDELSLATHATPSSAPPNDYEQAKQFLLSYRGSNDTFNAYRRDIERFAQWVWLIKDATFNEIKRIDFEDFIAFCQNPPQNWISNKQSHRFLNKNGKRTPNPNWRPFVVQIAKAAFQQGIRPETTNYQFSQKALESMMAVISSFYQFMIQSEYLEVNPVALIRQKSKYIRKTQGKSKIRRLSELQWGYIMETAYDLAKTNPTEHERTLFIMSALYGLYLRISELAASKRWSPQMNHFFRDSDGHWWFTTVGKGNKQRDIAVSDAMLDALKRYRTHLNLTPLPDRYDNHPLLPKSRSKGPISSTRRIRMIVQYCFDQTTQKLIEDGFREEADQLKAATVHWLRHTGISDDVKNRPREHVRDDAGHGSSEITDKYIDIELRERHASSKQKKLSPDDLNKA